MNNRYSLGSSEVLFSSKDIKKIKKMKGNVNVISTVCPDYSNNGKTYTFIGELGDGIGLVAQKHLEMSVPFLSDLKNLKLNPYYTILTADLPETVESQKEFYSRVSRSREEYLHRCELSSKIIGNVMSFGESKTFSKFYGDEGIDYLHIQENVARKILEFSKIDDDFHRKFWYFIEDRRALAEKFRSRSLSDSELEIAAAHGMSLYVTHGTLLKSIYEGQNMIVLNHATINLKNFFLCEFVDGYEYLKDSMNFPIGIVQGDFY